MSTVFHSSPPPWYADIKDLKPGGKRRVGDALLASFNGKAYHLYSFRDKTSEVYEPQMSLAERLKVIRERQDADLAAAETREPPLPAMHHPQDWPVEARVWMHKAGLSNDDIHAMGAYWNPRMERVVVPYRTVDGGRAWIARCPWPPSRERPKYLFPVGTKRGGGAMYGGVNLVLGIGPTVLCEDVLSAFRVWLDPCYTSVAVQGTSLDRDAIVALAAWDRPVITWLDPDHWGQLGARNIRAAFSRLGVKTANILSDKDPKYYTAAEIEVYVDDALQRIE